MPKKIIVSVLVFSLLAALCACGEEAENTLGMWSEDGKRPYDYSLDKYIVLGEYNGISATKALNETDLYAGTVRVALEENTVGVILTGCDKAETGDVVTLNCKSYLGEEPCDFYNKNGVRVVVNGGSFAEGISDKYIARLVCEALSYSVLENEDASLTVPDYADNSVYAGKTVTLKTEIVKTERADLSTLTDEKTAELVEKLSAEDAEAEAYAERKLLWQGIVDDSVFLALPEAELTRCKKEYTDYLREIASYNGMTYSSYIKSMGKTDEGIASEAAAYAEKKVKSELTAFAICKKENLDLSESAFKEKAYKLSLEMGYSGYDDMLNYNGEEEIYVYVAWYNAACFAVNNANYTKNS